MNNDRSVPVPESASELTVRLSCAGTIQSSSASSPGRKRAGRSGVRLGGAGFDVLIRRQDKNHMARSFLEVVCAGEYATGPGAQTGRRGTATGGRGRPSVSAEVVVAPVDVRAEDVVRGVAAEVAVADRQRAAGVVVDAAALPAGADAVVEQVAIVDRECAAVEDAATDARWGREFGGRRAIAGDGASVDRR